MILSVLGIITSILALSGTARVIDDIKLWIKERHSQRRKSEAGVIDHNDLSTVPADTEGQSILEAYFWIGSLLTALDILICIFLFTSELDASEMTMAVLMAVAAVFQIAGLVVTVWVTTWFEIVQGFTEHVNGTVAAAFQPKLDRVRSLSRLEPPLTRKSSFLFVNPCPHQSSSSSFRWAWGPSPSRSSSTFCPLRAAPTSTSVRRCHCSKN